MLMGLLAILSGAWKAIEKQYIQEQNVMCYEDKNISI